MTLSRALRVQARDIRLGLRDRKTGRHVRNHDHRQHPLQSSW